jgi:hypothetical protein
MKLLLVAFVAALVGCVDGADPVEIGTAPPLVLHQEEDPSGHPVLVSDDRTIPPIEMARSACICTDNACASEALEETLGCGTCVTVVCDDGRRVGGCVPCPDEVERTVD